MVDQAPERRKKEAWQVDKKIPLSLIFVLLLQTGSFVAWAANLASTVSEHERRILIGENFDRDYTKTNIDMCQRLARVEEKTSAILLSMQRIEQTINDTYRVDRK